MLVYSIRIAAMMSLAVASLAGPALGKGTDVVLCFADSPEATAQLGDRYVEVRRVECDVKINEFTQHAVLFIVRTKRSGESTMRTVGCDTYIDRPDEKAILPRNFQIAFGPNGDIGVASLCSGAAVQLDVIPADSTSINLEDESLVRVSRHMQHLAIGTRLKHGLGTDEDKARHMSIENADPLRRKAKGWCLLQKHSGDAHEDRSGTAEGRWSVRKLEWDNGWHVTVSVSPKSGSASYNVRLSPRIEDGCPIEWRSAISNERRER